MKVYLISLSTLLLMATLTASALAASPAISGSIGYETVDQPGQSKDSIPYAAINFEYDLSKTLSFHSGFESSRTNTLPISDTMNYVDLDLKQQNITYAFGQPSYTPGNGFVASISGLNSLKTTFRNKIMRVTGFYSDDGQKVLAADFNRNFAGRENLTVNYTTVKTDDSFAGLTISAKVTSNAAVCIETAKNLNTQETGYQITTSYGGTQHPGDAVFSVSYRNVQPGAVSGYCVDSNYDDSKGIRLETTYEITPTLMLTAYQDFVRSQNNTDKDESVFTLSRNF